MAGKINVEIITPYGTVYKNDVVMVTAKGTEGYMGILYDHQPMVTGLDTAPLKIKEEGGEEVLLAVSGGFMDIRPDRIVILANTAEKAEDIDVERAKKAKERAEVRLRSPKDNVDYARARAALQRAITRIKVADKESYK